MPYAPFDLTGKVALVTGGNGGIGLGMAEALAQAGASIAIWGTNAGKNEAAEKQLADAGHTVRSWKVNVANEDEVDAAMADTAKAFGRIDSVFANAGVGAPPSVLSKYPTDSYRRIMSVNVDGVFFTLRAAAAHMVERAEAGDPGGSLVAVSSMGAIMGTARNTPYGASKGAVISMIRAIAVEHARYGVRANAILPGWIATDMTDRALRDERFAGAVLPRIPARRWGEADDFGGIAVYLASDASAYATGEQFLLDGGYTKF
jgi:NAD(P)-dependent dehydrogenase (short-subunit alcohol dehydrogenase family)